MQYPKDYLRSFDRLIGHEGQYQNHHDDHGNWTGGQVGVGQRKGTKWGLSAATYPMLDIKALTREDAKAIYYRDFWCKLGGSAFHQALMYQLMDGSVHHGCWRAMQFLQRAVGAKDDGYFGPKTLAAVQAADLNDALMVFLAERLDFMNDLSTWSTFSRGWSQRIADNLRYAAQDN